MRLFCRNKRGALLIVFAVMLPVILALFALALDGANSMRTRSRLNDAVKQGLYAVAVEDLGSNIKNQKRLLSYAQAYLPGVEMDMSSVNLEVTEVLSDKPKLTVYINPNKSAIKDGYSYKYKYRANMQVKMTALVGVKQLSSQDGDSVFSVGSDSQAIEAREKFRFYSVGENPALPLGSVTHTQYSEPGGADEFYNFFTGCHGEKRYLGFIPHEDTSINFPTTGYDGAQFFLYVDNVDLDKLDWTVTEQGLYSGIQVKLLNKKTGYGIHIGSNYDPSNPCTFSRTFLSILFELRGPYATGGRSRRSSRVR